MRVRTLLLSIGIFFFSFSTVHAAPFWTNTTTGGPASGEWWQSFASSADGTKLVAGVYGGDIWTSTDSGASWTNRTTGTGASGNRWYSLASSADGATIVAIDTLYGNIWVSTDSGVSWTNQTAETVATGLLWISTAASADGVTLAAVSAGTYGDGDVWISNNSGVDWSNATEGTGAQEQNWVAVAMSADGAQIVAATYHGDIWTSTDSGATWTNQTTGTGASGEDWYTLSSSADGSKLAAAVYSGDIWTSEDSGITWVNRTAGTTASGALWYDINSSSDGTKLVAAHSGGIFVSPDSGATWVDRATGTNVQGYGFQAAGLSSDGTKLAASQSFGDIWTATFSYSAPAISNVSAAINPGIATISWDTDIAADSAIAYGTTSTYTATTTLAELVTTHGITLTGMECSTLYHYRVMSRSSGGVATYGADATFTTDTNCGPWRSVLGVDPAKIVVSSDGTNIALIDGSSDIYFSTTTGATWATSTPNSNTTFSNIAANADFTQFFTVGSDGVVYTSSNLTTWSALDSSAPPISSDWLAIDASSDATKVVAVMSFGDIWTSADSGVTWINRTTGTSATGLNWNAVASSGDGSVLAAGVYGGDVWVSTDSGATWVNKTTGTGASGQIWRSMAASSDGTSIAAAVYGGDIWVSTDSGATWTNKTTGTGAQEQNWVVVTLSDDGTALRAVALGGDVWASDDSGATWNNQTTGTGASGLNWNTMVASADGVKLAATTINGDIWTSTDSGATWTNQTTGSPASGLTWESLTSSSDGVKLAAVAVEGDVWTSSDSGATWVNRTSGQYDKTGEWWKSITSSADGTKLIALSSDVWRSTDSGVSWAATAGVPIVENCYSTITSSGMWAQHCAGATRPLRRSVDGGHTWSVVPNPALLGYEISILDIQGSTLVAIDDATDNIYSSTDNGATWTEHTGQTPYSWSTLQLSPDATKLFASSYANNCTVYVSTNLGATWTSLGIQNDCTNMGISADGQVLLFADQTNALFTSLDGGVTHAAVVNPIGLNFGVLAVSQDGSRMLAGDATSPYLWVRYSTPTVTTQSASAVGQTTATLNGTVTDTGGGAIYTRGFVYGTTASYGATTTEAGSFTLGAYTAAATTLTCNTLYYTRAYASNSFGTGYGSEVTFTTSACADDGGGGGEDAGGPGASSGLGADIRLDVLGKIQPQTATSTPLPAGTQQQVAENQEPKNKGEVVAVQEESAKEPIVLVYPQHSVVPPTHTPQTPAPSVQAVPAKVEPPAAPQKPPVQPQSESIYNSRDSLAAVPGAGPITATGAAAGIIFLLYGLTQIPLSVTNGRRVVVEASRWLLYLVAPLRKRTFPWGTVYDAATKEPIDPAQVHLLDMTGTEVAVAITDMDGRFGFIVAPGTYRLQVDKTNYTFPSKRLAGKRSDIVYDDLYFGDTITIDEAGSIRCNVPMDPVEEDWNQLSKRRARLTNFVRFTDRYVVFFGVAAFVVGFGVSVWQWILEPTLPALAVVGCYGAIAMLYVLRARTRLYGRVLYPDKTPLSFGVMSFTTVQGIELSKRVLDAYGRYVALFPAAKISQYHMTIAAREADETYVPKIEKEVVVHDGLLNDDFVVQ